MTSATGASPLPPQRKNQNKKLSMKEKQKKLPAPSRWSRPQTQFLGGIRPRQILHPINLLELARKG